jgi:hypothetical protein
MQTHESFDRHHDATLPELLAGEWGAAAAKGAAGRPPLALRLTDGRVRTGVPGASGVVLVEKAR